MFDILLYTFISVVCGLISIVALWSTFVLRRRGSRAVGTVTSVRTEGRARPGPFMRYTEHRAEVAFTDATGQTVSGALVGRYRVGEAVPVVYFPDKPEKLWPQTMISNGRLVASVLTAVVMILLMVLAVLVVAALFEAQDDLEERRREFERIGDPYN